MGFFKGDFVAPAKAGAHVFKKLDSRLRGNDGDGNREKLL
jgi:hypothetical protein